MKRPKRANGAESDHAVVSERSGEGASFDVALVAASAAPAPANGHVAFLVALEEATTSLVWSTDAEGHPDYVNRAWREYTGLTLEQVVPGGMEQINHPDDAPRKYEAWEQARRTGQPCELEYRYRRHDGQFRWFLGRVVPIRDARGRVARWVGTMTDIHERRLAEEELRLSEERYRSLVSATTAIVWTTDAEGRFVVPQPAWEAYTGQPWAEHRGSGWQNAVHPDDRAELLERWNDAMQTASTYQAGGRLWHAASGQYRYFVVRAVPMLDADGGIREWIGTVADADEKRRADRERDQALSLLDTLLQGVPVGFAFLDKDLRFRLVNRALAEISGIPVEAHIGRSAAEVVPDLAGEGEAVAREVMRTGQPIVSREVVGRTDRETGVQHHWLESWYPVPGTDGECLGVGAVVVEVSAMRAAQQEIADLNQRLHRAVYESSHRLKNHLQTLAATIDMILLEAGDAVSPDQVRRLGTQVRMLAGIHDLLTLATKAEAGADALSSQALLSRVISALPPASGGRRLGLKVEDVPLSLRHASALALIVNEAISNSQKHGRGTVEVTFRSEEGYGVLEVRDEGPGFPAGFDPHRAANTGLELIASLVNSDLQGEVGYDNAPEGGARVVVTFSLPRPRAVVTPQSANRSDASIQ